MSTPVGIDEKILEQLDAELEEQRRTPKRCEIKVVRRGRILGFRVLEESRCEKQATWILIANCPEHGNFTMLICDDHHALMVGKVDDSLELCPDMKMRFEPLS